MEMSNEYSKGNTRKIVVIYLHLLLPRGLKVKESSLSLGLRNYLSTG